MGKNALFPFIVGIAVPNETDAVEPTLIADNFDSIDLIDSLMFAEEEPRSLSDVVPRVAGLDESSLGPLDSIALPPVDMTAFKSLPFADTFSNGLLFVFIVVFLIAGLYILGAAMKLACRVTGGKRITVRRGIIATILMSATYGLAAIATERFSSGLYPFYMLGLQVTVGTLVLAALLWQNPIRALATGIVASILQTIFLFGLFAATFISIGKFVPPQKLLQLADHTQSFTDSLAKDVLPGDEEKTRQFLSIQSLVDSPSGHATAEGKPKAEPILERGMHSNPFVE